MIIGMGDQIKYDWVGGDSIYGNSTALRTGLTEANKLFVMDTSEKQLVYLEHPKPYIPDSKPGKGRKKTSFVSDVVPIKVKDFSSLFEG